MANVNERPPLPKGCKGCVFVIIALIFCFVVFPIILSASYSHYLWFRSAKMANERQPVSQFEKVFGSENTIYEGEDAENWERSSIEKSFGISISDRQRIVRFCHEGFPYVTVLLVYDMDSGETVWVKVVCP